MKIMVVADGHYYRASNNEIYVDSVFDYNFYKRYLQVYDDIIVVARIENLKYVPNDKKKASGENIEFWDLPNYKGPFQYAKKYFLIKQQVKKYVRNIDAAIFRLPGATANIMCMEFSKLNKPFAVEVVVDPWEYFKKGTVKSIVRPIVRLIWTRFVKKMCLKANGVSYVTEYYLQKRYPCKALINPKDKSYFTSYYSSVDLKSESIHEPKEYSNKAKYIISHVANAFTGYGKGHLTLMRAVKLVLDKGYNVEVQFIGDGPLKNEFIEYSKKLDIKNNVMFLGKLPSGEAVREAIAESDLFVFPTLAEGLPRVLLEAMSVGLPCISSPICGIPEILDSEFLVEYDDYKLFADKIIQLITNPDTYVKASKDNIATTQKYTDKILNIRRRNFYQAFKDII